MEKKKVFIPEQFYFVFICTTTLICELESRAVSSVVDLL